MTSRPLARETEGSSGESAFIKDAAQGGLRIEYVVAGKLMRCRVENDRGSKLSGWYRYFESGIPGGIWGNWKTGEKGIWSAKQALTPYEAMEHRARIQRAIKRDGIQHQKAWIDNLRMNVALWEAGRRITAEDPVARYLASRDIPIPNTPALRYVSKAAYYERGQLVGRFPAMLAAVTNSDGGLVSIHRTFLTPHGKKADVSTPRKLMPLCGTMLGASIKLGAPAPYPGGVMLGVAEGIETALAVTMLYGLPCWSAVSANGLRKIQVPSGVTSLFVMGDNDRNGVGQRAAQVLTTRVKAMGIKARSWVPQNPGSDWNDELLAKRPCALGGEK
jgi:hypothetical protein